LFFPFLSLVFGSKFFSELFFLILFVPDFGALQEPSKYKILEQKIIALQQIYFLQLLKNVKYAIK